MPQLNPEFWISQIFWLTITFGILYIVLSKLILPKISANLELRKSQIQENIEAAEKQRKDSESKLKEYDNIILKSKLEALQKELVDLVRTEIGPIAKPEVIQWAPGLPKTRSGKIMRRILRKIAANELDSLGDTSTLADPAVVEDLVANRVQS